MYIPSELINFLFEIDEDASLNIINKLNSKLSNITFISYPLSESYCLGYKKGLELYIQLLRSDRISKNLVISNINNIDTFIYDKYSCRGQFVTGFINSYKLFLNELIKYKNLELSPSN